MSVLPGWEDSIKTAALTHARERDRWPGLPRSIRHYEEKIRFIDSRETAEAMAELAGQRPLSHVGIDTEFHYHRPPVRIDRHKQAEDPSSVHPLLLSLSMVEVLANDEMAIYRFVVNLEIPEVFDALRDVLNMPVCFCGHYLKVEFFCLWKLGLPIPVTVWDSFVAETAVHLGQYRAQRSAKESQDDAEQAREKSESEEKKAFRYSLLETCHRYGVSHGLGPQKERLQRSFLDHVDGVPYTEEQIAYAAEDASAAAMLYPLQVINTTKMGILQHLMVVEMPWVITNASMEWRGVRIDEEKRDQYLEKIPRLKELMIQYLSAAYGLGNVNSHPQLKAFFDRVGILDNFRVWGKFSFNRNALEKNEKAHPAIPIILKTKRIGQILGDAIMKPEHIGNDGRMHPDHRQLGADSGRQASRWPNLLGLGRIIRPLVIPQDGYGIGEVDWSQVEVGVAGAVYHDDALVEMFNSGDVYAAMAQKFFHDQLTAEERALSGGEFKKRKPALRDLMKTCTLGIIYGMSAVGLARRLGCPDLEARRHHRQFMGMFPVLVKAVGREADHGAVRGYAATCSGLRRYLPTGTTATCRDRNWMLNLPVQGSAAVVFKTAGNRLYRLYQRYDARLIVPMHDAFVFEAPLDSLADVADLTNRVMCDTLQEYFPELRPKAEPNISHPECWNKDGVVDALGEYFKKVEEMLGQLPAAAIGKDNE